MHGRTHPLGRRGAILPLLAVLLPVLLALTAFAVDVAWMHMARTELRTATDAAARAGVKTLSLTQSVAAARAAAVSTAAANRVVGVGLQLNDAADIDVGTCRLDTATGRYLFDTNTYGRPNAMRVLGRRDSGSLGGPVGLLFAGVLGVTEFQPTQVATATLMDRDICLVIDRSSSMARWMSNGFYAPGAGCGPVPDGTRMHAIENAVNVFLDELDLTHQYEEVALVTYSGAVQVDCDPGTPGYEIDYPVTDTRLTPTLAYDDVRAAMTELRQTGVWGPTLIGEGLEEAVRVMSDPSLRPFSVKTIVLMTDGNADPGVDPLAVAAAARAGGMIVNTVTFSPGASIAEMQAVASAGGGIHLHADTAAEIEEVFREMARTMPVLVCE